MRPSHPKAWRRRARAMRGGRSPAWAAIARNRGRMGPRALKTLRSHVARDFTDLRIADVHTADGHAFDGHIFDAEVRHPVSGRPFRPEIVSVIDIASRQAVGWSAGLAESAWVVADAPRAARVGAGIPAICQVDRGKGFQNAMHDAAETGFLARLGITKQQSPPYNMRYVRERASGFYFEPSKAMVAAGICPQALGKDPVVAVTRAQALLDDWNALRAGRAQKRPLRYPEGPRDALDAARRRTAEWRDKSGATLICFARLGAGNGPRAI